MSELNDLIGVEVTPISLDDMVKGTPLPQMEPPKSAIRNRAATIALTSEPDKALENYQIMMTEAESGGTQYTDVLKNQVVTANQEKDQSALMSILADKNIPYEQKKAAIERLNFDPALKDTSAIMHDTLAAKSSEGESPDEEDARINATSTALGEIHKMRQERQALLNAHMAGLRGASAGTVGEMAALWVMPFGNNIAVAREKAEQDATWKEVFKAFTLPGSDVKKRREQLEKLPPAARSQMHKSILENLQNSSGVVFSDNDFQEWQRAVQILEEDGYSDVDVWLDNLSGVLDIVGLGSALKSGIRAAKKAIKAKDFDVDNVRIKTPVGIPTVQTGEGKPSKVTIEDSDLAQLKGKPTVGAFDSRIAKLEEEKALLLGEAGNTLDKGKVASLQQERKKLVDQFRNEGTINSIAKDLQASKKITSKAAKKEAEQLYESIKADYEAKISRIDRMLEVNKNASTVSQRIDAIDKEIEALSKRNTPMFISKSPIADTIERLGLNAPVGNSHPLSAYSTIKQANPEKARETFAAIVKGDDAVAEGLANTSKQDAIANDVFPKVLTESGKVEAAPVDIQRTLRRGFLPESIREFLANVGRVDFTPMEKARIMANVQRDFQSAKGLVMHESMGGFQTSFKADGGSVRISAVYGKAEGAWSNAQDAVEQAKYALAKYGILDNEIQLLKKEGLDYTPVKLEDVKDVPGSYMVRLETKQDFSVNDYKDPINPVSFEGITTKLNFVDRMLMSFKLQGGMSSYLADNASRIDPKITHATTSATDYTARLEKLLLDEAAKYSDQYVKLPKEAQKRVDEYLFESNLKGLKMDIVEMSTVRGMSNEEISAVKSFRDYWDAQFYLENADVIRQYNEQGFMLFKSGGDEFHVKPVAKNKNLYNQSNLYDPTTQQVRLFSKQEIDDLYNNGGSIYQFRRPVDINGEIVTHMTISNTPNQYARKFRDTDMVLNYREGYFTVHYDRPRFIDEFVMDANGNEVRRAVAVGKDSVEAEAYVRRANKNAAPGVRYAHRADDRMLRRGSDDWFDVEGAKGRIAQRHRGKNLEAATSSNNLGGFELIENPVSSSIKAAKSIAGRVVARPVFETAKGRIMEQFKDLFPKNDFGEVRWPRSIDEIGDKGGQVTKEVADARTNWAHIHHLENGYINGMDEFFKQNFYAMAEKAGELGLGKTQRGLLEVAKVSPTGAAKQSVFTAMIAANPVRQIFVQMHQGVRTFAYNAGAWFNGSVIKLPTEYTNYVLAGRPSASKKPGSFISFVEDSGIMDAVDKQNLVRATLLDAAEARTLPTKAASKTFEIMRKAGFDQGEKGNMLIHMAAVYDKYVRQGANVADSDIKAKMASEARALSYEMNFAGDMPYNQNSAAFFLQFLQVPHKAFLQAFNRKLTPMERMRLITSDAILWGPPVLLANELSETIFGEDILPEDKKLREILTEGLEAHSMNQMFRWTTGNEKIHIDFTSLAPTDYMGWHDMLYAFYTGGIQKMMLESPAGQMFFSEQGRVRTAMASAMRFMGLSKPIGETPDSFMQVMNEVAKVSSGWSNAQKAALMLETYKRYDAYGKPAGDMEHAVEAFAQALGFGGMSQKRLYELSKERSDTFKSFEEEVKFSFKEALRYYQSNMGKGIQNMDQLNAVAQFMLSKYENNPEAYKIIQKELQYALQDPEQNLLSQIVKSSNIPGIEKTISEIKLGPFTEDDKERAIRILNDAKKFREENEVQ